MKHEEDDVIDPRMKLRPSTGDKLHAVQCCEMYPSSMSAL